MAGLVVNTDRLDDYAYRLNKVHTRIRNLEGRVDRLYWLMCSQHLLDIQYVRYLSHTSLLSTYGSAVQKCATYLTKTSQDFQKVEKELAKTDPLNFRGAGSIVQNVTNTDVTTWDHVKWWQQYLRNVTAKHIIGVGTSTGAVYWLSYLQSSQEHTGFSVTNSGSVLTMGKKTENSEQTVSFVSGSTSAGFSLDGGKYKDKSILGGKDHLNVNKKQDKKPGKQVNKDEDWYDSTAILEGKAELKAEGSVIQGKVSGEGEYAQGSVDARFITGEAQATAAAGFYMYTKDKDGNTVRVFSPGVSAEVGASVAVMDVEAEGRLGLGEDNNMLGVYGKGEVEALSAEAKAKFALSTKEVYAGASAEADLAKVTGTGGVSVLGTDVGVTGSLKVGVGAHAEMGYTDGKFKVDVGAAVGVGFDLGFEVDIGGTVEAITANSMA